MATTTVEDNTVALAENVLNPAGNRLVGKIDGFLSTHPGLHNISTIARRVKAGYRDTEIVLGYMVRNKVYVAADGNGCWRKYGTTSPQV